MSKLTPHERMIRARISLLMDQPFFGVLAMRLKLVEAPAGPMNPFGTMATDGNVITYCPDFVTKLTDAEIKGVIAHEIMHVAQMHHLRRGRRDPGKWNKSCVSEGTLVLMADGAIRPIEEVLPGEYVASPFGPNLVLGTMYNGEKPVVELCFDNHILSCTDDHLIATPKGFISAKDFCASPTQGLIAGQPGGSEVYRGELLSTVFDAVKREDRSFIFGHRGAFAPQRVAGQPLDYQADQSGTLYDDARDGSGLHGWDRGRGGDNQCRQQEQEIYPADAISRQHLRSLARLADSACLLLHNPGKPNGNSILSVLNDGVASGTCAEAVAAISRHQEAARASLTAPDQASRGAELPHGLHPTHAGNRFSHQGVERAQGSHGKGRGGVRKVYDLVTAVGVYFANGVLVHNCDYTINETLKASGFSLPSGGLFNPAFKDWAAETIYDTLPDDKQDGGGGGGGGKQPNPNGNPNPNGKPDPNQWGTVLDHPAQSEAERSAAENDMRMAVKQAAKAQEMHDKAKSKGTKPAWLKRLIDEVTEPQVRWEDLLRRFVSSRIPYDYTWARPSRRGIANGMFLPGSKKEGLGEVVFFIDTSGSISARELSHFVAEANYVLQDLHPERVHILFCDAQVGNYITLDEGDDIPLDKIVGGGGSDFRPAFQYLIDNDIRPVAGVVLSDMMIDFPQSAPNFPVFMVSTTEHRGPAWGAEQVRLRIKH